MNKLLFAINFSIITLLLTSTYSTAQVIENIFNFFKPQKQLNVETISSGLKDALAIGTKNAVAQTSREGGFSGNPALFISVPDKFNKVAGTIRKIGFGHLVDNFEAKMNQAAEAASSKATPVFIDAIKKMNFEDAKTILQGQETAATDYFREKTEEELRELFAPIVSGALSQLGTVDVYNTIMEKYASIPYVSKPNFNLEKYVTQKALEGLFTVVAEEERKIRENPAARTTKLLRKVFKNP